MKKRAVMLAACIVATAAIGMSGQQVYGATTADGGLAVAGVSATLTGYIASGNTGVAIDDEASASEASTEDQGFDYADTAIAQVNDYVNIRSEANEDSEQLGKLYSNCKATVLGTEGDWTKIQSGSVTGYIKTEYLSIGDKDVIDAAATRVATVNTQTLYVRNEATTDSSIIELVPDQEELTVVDVQDGWVEVSVEAGDGYVSSDYVTVDMRFDEAESKEEEEARLAKEQAEREAAAAAAAAKAAQQASSTSSSSTSSGQGRSYSAPSGCDGSSVAAYASQFVGNPYSYGGCSLTNGTDCSGFVMSVYAAFGVSLPHSSSGMRSVGYEVSVSDMQPGDIVCYSGHVGIYVGNDTIVHASTPATGIKFTSPANYKSIICVRRIF